MAKRVNPTQTRRIVELHEQGHTFTDIAQQLGLNRHTVARHVSSPLGLVEPRAGVTPRVLQNLLKLAAHVQEFPCPNCKAPLLALSTQYEGSCRHCRHWFGATQGVRGIPWAKAAARR